MPSRNHSHPVGPPKPGPGALPTVAATRAFDMLDSIGARTSFTEGTTGDAYVSVSLVQQTLTDLRIGHIRENQVHATAHPTTFPRQRDAFQTLNANIGTKVIGPLGRPDGTTVTTGGEGTVQEFATQIKTVYGGFAGGIIEGVENGNEWNGAKNGPGALPTVVNPCGDGKDYKQWAWQLRQWQKDIDTYFRNDVAGGASLQGIFSIAPALVGGPGITKYNDLGNISQWVDKGNYHYYTDTDPVPTYLVPNFPASTEVTYASPSVHPLWCTETGLNNAINQTSGLAAHPESVAAVYMPRLLLEHKWFGNERTYQFELLDDHDNQVALDNPEDNWGVVRYDGSQKPVYGTWKTMVDTIYDAGVTAATFTPQPLNMTLTGPSDMRYLLFQKSNGHYVLAIWRNVSIWDASARTILTPSASNATLTLTGVMDLTIRNGLTSSTTSISSNTTTVALAGDMALINIGGS